MTKPVRLRKEVDAGASRVECWRVSINHSRFRNARAEQRRQAAIADDDSGEPAWRSARAKFESSGQGAFPRFQYGARGAGSDLGADGTGRLYLSVLSRPGAGARTRRGFARAGARLHGETQRPERRPADAVAL